MKIAVINEISAAERNHDILNALKGRGHEIFNVGNISGKDDPALLYIHTGLMSALLLHLKVVDFVIGGCGTGIGYLNSVMQYPGVFCGHILTPLDAWLFARINAGNCISLALNQGYGWAGDVNLRLVFDALFTQERGAGYPPQRAEPQREARLLLENVSSAAHRSMADIMQALPAKITQPALTFPAFRALLEEASRNDRSIQSLLDKI